LTLDCVSTSTPDVARSHRGLSTRPGTRVRGCYTLNTTGSEYGYGPGRKVSETCHTVLGRHTETGQPTASGSARVDRLRSTRKPLGQVPAQTGKAQALPQRKTTLVAIIRTSNRKETGTQGVASLIAEWRGVVPEARPGGTTPRVGNRCIVADGLEARGDTAAPRGQETRGIMLPLASLSLTPDDGEELWALPALDSGSVSPLIRDAYNDYDAGHTPHQGEGR
jgi:hypothetical protein